MSQLAPRAKYPSAKFDTVGKTYSGVVAIPTEDRQARKYGSTELATWPDGSPIMQTRIVLALDGTEGEQVAIYAQKSLAKAITKALVDAEAADVEVGGHLTVRFTGTEVVTPGAQPAKQYEAKYTPPADDGWDPADLT